MRPAQTPMTPTIHAEAQAGWKTCPTRKEAPVGVEPTMADLQFAAAERFADRDRTLRKKEVNTSAPDRVDR
jgi:hypothetical protein